MKIRELSSFLESVAPIGYQEDYDNSGLIVGEPDLEISSAIISLDCTEAVVDEAIEKGCNIVISHHPIVFKGLKKFNRKTYVERVVMKAIKHDIALYAIHTNLDHVKNGVNAELCRRLGIKDTVILSPKSGMLRKLVTFVPLEYAERIRAALFDAGAGEIGKYSQCSFNTRGSGTFKGNEGTNAFAGKPGELHTEAEIRIETIFPVNIERQLLVALLESHPYEEVAYDIYDVKNAYAQVGAGMIGNIDEAMDERDFLMQAKKNLGLSVVRHTDLRGKKVRRVAVCGGSGGFLLPRAIAAGADVFITADYKYHEFFDAEGKIIIADIGHFESEQFTQQLLYDIITKKFPNFALHLTEVKTNPINYII